LPAILALIRTVSGKIMAPGVAESTSSPKLQLSSSVELTCFALCMAQGVYLIASFLQGSWVLDVHGQPIATDFVNIWSGGHQSLLGEDPAAIYDVQLHKNAEAAALGHEFPGEYPWLYPPTFLLVASSLALLPFVPAYVAWVTLTFSAYLAAMRGIIQHRAGILLACAYPGVLSNIIVGQNGFLSAALFGGSLLLLQRRPVLAGCFIGLLSFKPHLGILFPLVLLAGGYWRTIAAAVATTVLLVVASCAAFGAQAWVAGEAFAEAVKKIVAKSGPNGITRAGMLEAIKQVNDFDAGGFVAPTDIGARKSAGCLIGMQVKSGKFVRVDPVEPGKFDCNGRIITITMDPVKAYKG
jgi:hypothetical protein